MRHFAAAGCTLLLGTVLSAGTAVGQSAPKGSPPASSATASAGDAAAQARKLYEKGRALADAGKWDAAYSEFRAAYAWLDHWQIAGGVGDAAFALGKYPEAIEMLTKHLEGATNLSGAERADLEKRIAQSKQKCGILKIAGPAGADVKVDGALIGKLPLTKDLYALPGSHTVEVTSPAGTEKKTVEVAAGKEASTGGGSSGGAGGPGGSSGGAGGAGGAATVGPSSTGVGPVATGSPSATPVVTPGGDGKPSMVPTYVLGAAAGVVLVAGLGVFIASEVKGGEAVKARDEYLKLPAVEQQTDAAKFKVRDLLRGQDSLITGAVSLWIGAAVLGAGAGGYYMYRSGAGGEKRGQVASPKASFRWAPVVSPAGAGMVVQGSF